MSRVQCSLSDEVFSRVKYCYMSNKKSKVDSGLKKFQWSGNSRNQSHMGSLVNGEMQFLKTVQARN